MNSKEVCLQKGGGGRKLKHCQDKRETRGERILCGVLFKACRHTIKPDQ